MLVASVVVIGVEVAAEIGGTKKGGHGALRCSAATALLISELVATKCRLAEESVSSARRALIGGGVIDAMMTAMIATAAAMKMMRKRAATTRCW